MRTIESEADIREGLAALERSDPRLAPVIAATGPVPLRRREAGFSGLARIITAQQLSNLAAAAIWNRLEARLGQVTQVAVETVGDADLRGCGLSAAKVATLRALCRAIAAGQLDLDGLGSLPADEVREALCANRGIGPWTADIYLLFCIGHADIFPAGDLALRLAVGEALGLGERPEAGLVADEAARWSPWRGVAARLFWAFYAARRRRAGG